MHCCSYSQPLLNLILCHVSGMFQVNVQAAVDQVNLLSGVRNDIEFVFSLHHLRERLVCLECYILSSAYKSSAAETLLEERGRIDSSHLMIDATLECDSIHSPASSFLLTNDYRQAHEARAEFARQRSSLGSIQTRMVGVLSPYFSPSCYSS